MKLYDFNIESNSEPCGTPAFTNSIWKTDQLRQLFGICYREMIQLGQEDYYLFRYFLVYSEELQAKLLMKY